MMMQSCTMNSQASYCMSNAAAGTSVRICKILGTVVLAVSIFVRLISLLVRKV